MNNERLRAVIENHRPLSARRPLQSSFFVTTKLHPDYVQREHTPAFEEALSILCLELDKSIEKDSTRVRETEAISDVLFCLVMMSRLDVEPELLTPSLTEYHSRGFLKMIPHMILLFQYLNDPSTELLLKLLFEQTMPPTSAHEKRPIFDQLNARLRAEETTRKRNEFLCRLITQNVEMYHCWSA
jgi:hypothetical protein